MKFTDVTSSAVTVSWNISSTDCSDDAQCTYIVFYRIIGTEVCPEYIVHTNYSEIKGNGNKVTLQGLQPYTRYEVLVVQVNDTSAELANTTVSTEPDGKDIPISYTSHTSCTEGRLSAWSKFHFFSGIGLNLMMIIILSSLRINQ